METAALIFLVLAVSAFAALVTTAIVGLSDLILWAAAATIIFATLAATCYASFRQQQSAQGQENDKANHVNHKGSAAPNEPAKAVAVDKIPDTTGTQGNSADEAVTGNERNGNETQNVEHGWLPWLRGVIGRSSVTDWLLALFTIGLLVVGYKQATLVANSNDVARDAANAAKESAEAAKKSVELATDTSRKQLRAYVSVADGMYGYTEDTDTVKIELVLKNSGNTPAHKLRVISMFAVGTANLTANDLPPPSQDFKSDMILGSGNTTVIHAIGQIPKEAWAEYKAGKQLLWYWGSATYEDVFGETHTIKFRMMAGYGVGSGKGFIFAKDGNESD